MAEPRFERIVSEIVETAGAREVRVYTSIEEAVSFGVEEATAAHVFGHLADAGGGCVVGHDLDGLAVCDSLGCTGTCRLYSVPRNWKPGDGDPKPEKQPALQDAGRIYFCLCEH